MPRYNHIVKYEMDGSKLVDFYKVIPAIQLLHKYFKTWSFQSTTFRIPNIFASTQLPLPRTAQKKHV